MPGRKQNPSRSSSNFRRDERSISEVVGFVLMFGIIIASVGLVATVGLSEIENYEEHQQLQNAERSFQFLSVSFNELEESQAPVRTDTFDLSGGSVTVDSSSDITVTVADSSGSTLEQKSMDLNALVYNSGDTTFAYENGATFRGKEDPDSGIMTSEPGFICDGDRAIVSLVTIKSANNRQKAGESTVQITSTRTKSSLIYPDGSGDKASDADSVTLDYQYSGEDRIREWRKHFKDEDGWSWTNPNRAECGPGLDTVHVRRTVITISYT